MKVLSTYRILKAKAVDANVDESWIDWAIEMIEAGYESEHLYILAGQNKPYNQFELKEITDKVFNELHLDFSNDAAVIRNYVYYMISSSLEHPEKRMNTLREMKDLYNDSYFESTYQDFALLYWAKQDLEADEVQWYWEGANRKNIDGIIKQKFRDWIAAYNEIPE